MKKTTVAIAALLVLFNLVQGQKSPDEFFGLDIGGDRVLVKYPDIIRYLKYLEEHTGRIKLSNEGLSTRGNPLYLAAISSKDNLAHLQELREINRKLANPDTLSPDQARELIEKARVFVLITCTIHATEIGSSQMAMVLAHQLTQTRDTDLMSYLDDVVLLLMPSINPDGNIMVTEWYNKYVHTEYEGCRMPYLYHHYAGHDTNRDFYMLNLKETRVVNRVLHHRYFPHIFLDMHQMHTTGPRMFVPPFKDPLNQNLDPVLVSETNIIGSFMALRLQENQKKGVGHSYAFDAYWPGGSKNTAWYKNVVGLLTEMASVRVASPIYIEPNELRVSSKGLPQYKAQVNFPDPWPGGWWRLRDIIDYELVAARALLEIAAKNRHSFVNNFHQMGLTSIKKGLKGTPRGYLIPREQWDRPAAITFLKKMGEHGVRIFQIPSDTRWENQIYTAGDHVIPLNQPYGNFVRVMMERQQYPEIKHMTDGPIIEPYDAVGWTLPLQMGVIYREINHPLDGLPLKQVSGPDYPEPTITGQGNHYRIPGRYNRSFQVVNRLLAKKIKVYRYGGPSGKKVEPGDFLVKTRDIPAEELIESARGTGVGIGRITLEPSDSVRPLTPPAVAIYQSYRPSMDEGWTRWVMDHFQFQYTVIHNRDFNRKSLSKHGVIIFADQSRDTIVEGKRRGYWSYFDSGSPPAYRGGIGEKGIKALKHFVEKGGTVILLDSASELAVSDFKLPLSNTLEDLDGNRFTCPGSLLRLKVNPRDPLGWGLQPDHFIFFSRSPAFRTRPPVTGTINRTVVAGFNPRGPHLLSGYLKGGEHLDRAVMIIRFDFHKGHVIVLGGRVQHRAQTHGTFKFLFNSLYFPGLKK